MAIRGRVDGVEGRCIVGWATASSRRNCAITITDPAGEVLARGSAALARPDLKASRSDLKASRSGRLDLGFAIEIPKWNTAQSFRIFADGEELPGSPLEVGPGRYDGDIVIDHAVLKGWVRERLPALTEPVISVVTQHGQVVGQADAKAEPEAVPARAGFAIELGNACFGAGELRLHVLADGVPFAERACNLPLQGALDLLTPERCDGWLIAPDAPARVLEIEIFREGLPVARVQCGNPRSDVRDLFPPSKGGGFAASFPMAEGAEVAAVTLSLRLKGQERELFDGPFLVASREAAVIAAQGAAQALRASALLPAQLAVLQAGLKQFLHSARTGQDFVAARQPFAAPGPMRLRLTILIPIHSDIAATQACIDSVLAHRIAPLDRVVLIDDASPEPGMAELLQSYAHEPNLFVLRNPENLGFVQTVNRGLAFARDGDVLLLNADTVLFAGAFDELCAIAEAAPAIGTVTALSNDATIFSYPAEDLSCARLADCDWPELAQAALKANSGRFLDVPTAHGFCMLIRRALLREAGGFDPVFGRGYGEENDFSLRAADLGYRNVAAAGVLVQHCGSRSFGAERQALLQANLDRLARMYPEYFPRLAAFERADGLRAARWSLDGWRLRQARKAGAEFVLIIGNALGGGSAKAAQDIARDIGGGRAAKLELTAMRDGSVTLAGKAPLFRARFAPDELAPLFDLLNEAAPARVMVHQLLGYDAGFLARLETWLAGREAVYYLHDFYPLCPRVTFIDATGEFCDLAETARCERCLALDGAHEASRLGLAPAEHRAAFERLLQVIHRVVTPSASAASYLRRGFPDVAAEVSPHPGDELVAAAHWGPRPATDPAEILLLGALGPHKGAQRLLDIAKRARLTHPHLRFRVIGYTSVDDDLLPLGNVIITGRYTGESLSPHLAEASGNLALFLHLWPETYSYTLSEALRHGFVPLVPDLGAPAERVRALGIGLVYPRTLDAAGILQLIDAIRAGEVSHAPFRAIERRAAE